MTIELQRTHHGAGETLAAHRHRQAYAGLVLRGGYVEFGPDGAWACEAGDLVLHPPFHLHGDRMNRSGAVVLNFVLPFGSLAFRTMSTFCVVRPAAPERLERAASRDPASALAQALEDAERHVPARPVDWCDHVAETLASAPHKQVGSVARQHGVSPEHASRVFRRRFGVGPARFRAEQNLRRALRSLAGGCDRLADVAHTAGYADQAHMSRAVKAVTGVSPGQLRRSLACCAVA